MPVNRSTRTLLAAVFLIAALFVAMNYAVEATPLLGWWLPLVLLIIGVAIVASGRFIGGSEDVDADMSAAAPLHEYTFAPPPAAPGLTAQAGEVGSPSPEFESLDRTGQGVPTAKVEAPPPEVSSAERLQTDGVVLQPADTAENEFHTGEHVAHHLPSDALPEVTQTTGEAGGAGHAPIAPEERAVLDTLSAPEQAQDAVVTVQNSEATASLTPSSIDSTPASGSAVDNLTVIHGIGPKIAGALQAVGINSYARLSGATDADLESAIRAAGVRLAPTLTTWREQAAFLARGDRDGFESLRRKLTQGGVDSGD